MGLRREFLEHKSKTIESFNLVSSDVSTLNLNLSNLRTMLASIEEKITELGSKVSDINRNLRADIEIQNSTNASMASKIVDINSFVNSRISNFEREMGKIGQKVERKVKDSLTQISKRTTANSSLLKEISSRSKLQSSDLRKLKNLLNRNKKAAKKSDLELDAKLRSHKRRMQQLNRKIDNTAGRKTISRRTARKTITRTITPKKTVTTIKTPKRKITRTVTKNKTVTKKETPKTKKVYEVISEKNPLI